MRRIVTGARLRLVAALFGALLLADLVRRAGPSALVESVTTLGCGIDPGPCSRRSLAPCEDLGLADHAARSKAPSLLSANARTAPVVGGGGTVWRPGTDIRGNSAGLTHEPDGAARQWHCFSSTGPRSFRSYCRVGKRNRIDSHAGGLAATPKLSRYAGLSAFLLLGVIFATAFAAHRRWPVFSWSTRLLSRVPHFKDWMERKQSLIHSIENKLFDFYHQTPGVFLASFALNLACHLAAVFEVFLILWLMGAKISFVAALATEAWTKMINMLGLFNPGNVGTYEGGTMLVAKMLGLSGAAGLTLGLTRRFRAIFWAAVGGVCLAILSRSTKRGNLEGTRSDLQAPRNQSTPAENQHRSETPGRGHIALILVNDRQDDDPFGSRLPRVGALPVLLRVILGAKKAGATRIVVAVNQLTGQAVQRELSSTRRLPESVEWVQLGTGGTSLSSLLGQLAVETRGPLVLIAGDRTYQPSLHRRAGEWSEESGALALTSGSQPVGIFALSRDAAADFANQSPPNVSSTEDLHAWLSSNCPVEMETVQEDMWQRISNEQDRRSAEEKLNRWLVKPTDGIFPK